MGIFPDQVLYHVPHVDRQTLNYWTTREALLLFYLLSRLHFHMPTETSILTCIQSLKAQNLSGMINSAKSGSPVLSPKEDSRTSEEGGSAGTPHLWWPFLHLWMLPSPEFGFPGGSVVKNLPANAGDTRDTGLIPESGRSPGEGNSNSLWYSCLEHSMDRWAWQATVLGFMKSRTQLGAHTHTHTHTHIYIHTHTESRMG